MSYMRSHFTLLASPVSMMACGVELVARAALKCFISLPSRYHTASPLRQFDGIAAPN